MRARLVGQGGAGMVPNRLWHALFIAAAIGWKMLWALILGFAVSGAIQAVVSRKEMAKLLPNDGPTSILRSAGLGAASSSCSYASTAIARSIAKQGGDFTSAMVFQFASTNLVLELGLILWTFLGWRFTLAQFIGGFVMIGASISPKRPVLREFGAR